MLKKLILILFFGLWSGNSFAEERITLTTYYPAPYGVYNQMVTETLGVGDNYVDSKIDGSDAPDPSNSNYKGDVWIKGEVSIGTTVSNGKLTVETNASNQKAIYGFSKEDIGVYGTTGKSDGYGVYGWGNTGIGVGGVSKDGYGIYGSSSNSYAGYFDDGIVYIKNNLGIGTTLSGGAGANLVIAGNAIIGSNYAGGGSGPVNGMTIEGPVEMGLTTSHANNALSIGGDYTDGGVVIGSSYAASLAPQDGLIVKGNVGIGTASPGYKLDVNGSVNISNDLTVGYDLDVNGDIEVESNAWGTCTWRTVPNNAMSWYCNAGEFVAGIGYEPNEWTSADDIHSYPEVDRLYCCEL